MKPVSPMFAAAAVSAVFCFCSICGGADAANERKDAVFVPVRDVKLTGGRLADLQKVNNHYIAYTIKPDRMLEPFRIQAGLPKKADRYDGWEDGELSGHCMGHYLSSLAYVYWLTKDPQAKKQADYVVDEIIKMQDADPDGYALPVPKKTFTDLRDNVVRPQPFNLNGIWAPFYTLHKVMAGLRDVYYATGSRKALAAEQKLADFVISVVTPLTPENNQRMLSCEFGGMDEVLADLTADTGDQKYLQCALKNFYHENLMVPMSEKRDHLTGRHVNTMIPEIIGMGRVYEITGGEKYRTIANFFYDRVVNHRSYATGGQGEGEYFFPIGDEARHITAHTTESCNGYNMLKLAKQQFEWDPKASFMDFAERVTLNHMASVIRRDREGAYCYFQPLASVAAKNFSSSEHVWTCCVGTGMENPARYGELVAAVDDGEVYLNQYWDSEVELKDLKGTLTVSGGFPFSRNVSVKVGLESSKQFELKLRNPYWSKNTLVKVNGQAATVKADDDGFLELDRNWKNGDTVSITFDFQLRVDPMTDKPDSPFCVMYGPFVLAGVVPEDPANPQARAWRTDGQTYETPPLMVAESAADVISKLAPAGKFGHFKSNGLVYPKDLEFEPLMNLMDEHYAVYFNRFTKQEWEAEGSNVISNIRMAMGISKRLVDEINPGFQQSEIDHKAVTGDSQSHATDDGRHFRFAPAGASFEYTVSKIPSEPVVLVVAMQGRNTALTVKCGGKQIFSEDVNTDRSSVEKTIAIPADAVSADRTAKLTFSGANGKASPQISKIRVLKTK